MPLDASDFGLEPVAPALNAVREVGPGASTTLSPDDLAKLQAQVAATHPSGTVALGAGGNAPVSLPPGLPAVNLPAAVGPATPEPIDVGGGRAVAEPAKAPPQVTLKAEDFGLDPTAAQPPPAPPTSQMTGIPRAIAFPASNIAGTAISTFGVPGDIVRGVGALAGEKAATDLQGAPLPLAPAPLPNPTPSPSGTGLLAAPRSGWPTAAAALFTPQQLAAAPGKQDVQPWMGNTPISSESLLALSDAAGLTNRSDLQPQTPNEKLEAAAAQGIGMLLPTALTGGVSDIPAALRLARAGIGLGIGSEAGGDVGQAVGGAPGRVVGSVLGGVASPIGGAVLSRGWQALAPSVLPTIAGARVPLGASDAAARAMAARAFSGANVTPPEAALLANPPELVPGSPTTSYQVTGNQTLGTMEKGIGSQVQYRPQFTDIRARQNAAQLGHIQRQAPEIGPGDVVPWFRGRLAALRTAEDAEMGAEREATQGAVEAGGQPAVPHVAGEAIRGAVMAARAPLLSASDARLAQAEAMARGATEALRGEPTPQADYEHGVRMRGSWPTEDVAPSGILGEKAQVHAAAKRLFDAVDPEKKLVVGGLSSVRDAAAILRGDPVRPRMNALGKDRTEYLSEIGAASKADLAGPESKVLDFATDLKNNDTFQNLRKLLRMVSTAQREIRGNLTLGRESLPYKRMGELRSEIETAMVRAASGAVEVDPDVAERLVAMAKEGLNGPVAGVGGRSGVQAGEGSSGAATGVPDAGAAGRGTQRGSGVAGGNSAVAAAAPGRARKPESLNAEVNALGHPGVPLAAQQDEMPGAGGAQLKPNFSAEDRANLKAANAGWAAYKARFGKGSVGSVLQSANNTASGFRVPDSMVPSTLFQAGPKGAEAADSLINAMGSEDGALHVLGEYPAYSLRAAAEEMGTLSVAKYEDWLKKYGPMLDRFPELKAQFDTAAKARGVLDDLRRERMEIDAANPVKPGWGDAEIMDRFVQAGSKGYEAAGDLSRVTNGSPRAIAATRDYLANILRNGDGRGFAGAEIKSGPNSGTLDAGAYQRFMRRYQAFLSHPSMDDARNSFETMGRAQEALDASAAAHTAAREAYEASAAKHFLVDDADPVRAVEKILDSGSAPQQMADLARQTAHDPAAREGIQAAIIRAMLNKVRSVNAIGTDLEAVSAKSNEVQKFVRRHVSDEGAALRSILTPEQLTALKNVALDMRRGDRAIASGRNTEGSPTAFLTSARHASEHKSGLVGTLAWLETLGEAGQEMMGQSGRIAAMLMLPVMQAARARGYRDINDLVAAALLHPHELSSLLKDVPTEASIPSRLAAIKGQLATMGGIAGIRGAQADQPERGAVAQ